MHHLVGTNAEPVSTGEARAMEGNKMAHHNECHALEAAAAAAPPAWGPLFNLKRPGPSSTAPVLEC